MWPCNFSCLLCTGSVGYSKIWKIPAPVIVLANQPNLQGSLGIPHLVLSTRTTNLTLGLLFIFVYWKLLPQMLFIFFISTLSSVGKMEAPWNLSIFSVLWLCFDMPPNCSLLNMPSLNLPHISCIVTRYLFFIHMLISDQLFPFHHWHW